jgi:hypothetical protein
MILTRLNVQQAGTNAIFARSQACARTFRRSSPISIVYWQRSAPGWPGSGNQKPFPLRPRTAARERGTHDEHAEAIGRPRSPISIARSLRTTPSSCSAMRTASAMGARLHRSIRAPGESNENARTLTRKCRSRRRFADLLTPYGRVERSATTKPPTFDGRPTVGRAFSNALTRVLSNRVGGPT